MDMKELQSSIHRNIKDKSQNSDLEVSEAMASDKRSVLVNIFLIFPRKHLLVVLIRSASVRHF